MSNKLNKNISNLKGIGILLVILGHMTCPAELHIFIYFFHMPLFFLASGYLFFGKEHNNWFNYVKKKFKKSIIPYTIFFIISYLYTNVIFAFFRGSNYFPEGINVIQILKALILSGGYLNTIPLGNFPLWFIPLFFIASIIFYFIKYIKNYILLFVLIFVLMVASIFVQSIIPGRPFLHINVLLPGLVFMAIGYIYNKYENKINLNGFSLYIFTFIALLIAYKNGQSNISACNTILYYFGASGITFFFYKVSSSIDSYLLSFLGDNSLFILGTHSLIISFINVIGITPDIFTQHLKIEGIMLSLVYLFVVVTVNILFLKLYELIKFIFKNFKNKVFSF